ncbi:transporter substrate-binding domain-containing protein [Glaciimonas immobilis]|uniref:Polar amino acid transport system substrate-binding protein n=1 Tax=Glaciimonas immobilis TaxID=728004 RepID=A0A840RSF3_9BURK|nr:transporter substrate-binding domain-containing protein [Glaciimonas immobilis]KAF3997691.1 transporter substrate-binding domain-containing protein [Glaciimonas immobilis]MBB5200593.1 polar amino acid transport system substrate-binding protein [Glaciimonas immobilis]
MKLKKMLLLSSLSVVVMSAQIAHADALADIQKSGTLRIAVPQDFPPYGSVTSDMQLQGLDIDVAKLLAKGMGVKAELIPVGSANRMAYLQTHKADVVVSSLGKNAEREKVISFSQPYAPFNNSLYGAADLKVASAADLANQTVGVARGTFEDTLLSDTVPKSTVMKRYEDNNTLISAYVSGQVRLIGTGDFVAITIGEKDPKHKPFMKYVIQESRCLVGLNKGEPALMAKVNEVLTKAKKSGELNAIVKKWLNVPLPDKLANVFE